MKNNRRFHIALCFCLAVLLAVVTDSSSTAVAQVSVDAPAGLTKRNNKDLNKKPAPKKDTAPPQKDAAAPKKADEPRPAAKPREENRDAKPAAGATAQEAPRPEPPHAEAPRAEAPQEKSDNKNSESKKADEQQLPQRYHPNSSHQHIAGRSVGYRIQAFSDNDYRTAKSSARSRARALAMKFPEYRSYLSYKAPAWRLRIGDFKTREEAREAISRIRRVYPAFAREMVVVKDRINIWQ